MQNIFKHPELIISYLEKVYKTLFYIIFVRSGIAKFLPVVIKFQYLDPVHKIDRNKLNYYLFGMNFIEGWFTKEAAQIFLCIDYMQKKEGIAGNLFEIGAHHGRSSIMLALMADPVKESLGLCDLFSKQEYNISDSGKGDKKILINNLSSYFDEINFVKIYEKQSKELTTQECKNCRFFHIDGGHSVDETYNDLSIAADSITETGVVAIDDFCNIVYPEVIEGVYRFLNNRKSLAPFALAFNKLFLCSPKRQSWYLERLFSEDSKKYVKNGDFETFERQFLGYKVVVIGAN
jgi:hypothetical protein